MNYIRGLDRRSTATRDIQHDYTPRSRSRATPADLVERMNLLLFGGTMPDSLRTQIVAAVTSRAIPAATFAPGTPASAASGVAPTPTNQAAIDTAKRDRVYLAVFLSMASPDYLIQK